VVDMRMHRGAVIPHVDERYLDNMYKVRGALQVMLAREVATRATPLQCEELQRLREAHEGAVAANDVLGCVKANRALHHATTVWPTTHRPSRCWRRGPAGWMPAAVPWATAPGG